MLCFFFNGKGEKLLCDVGFVTDVIDIDDIVFGLMFVILRVNDLVSRFNEFMYTTSTDDGGGNVGITCWISF